MCAALIEGGFRLDQLRLVVAMVEFQAFGLAQGLPAPAMSDHIRKILPASTASVDHSSYDLATATGSSVAMVVGGLEASRSHPGGP
ncbi:hypothetical protein ACLVWQ_39290 [Streptomyces sp. CWNU-52B]|uniref:hypothetical protein n=1 Tax=unclassified Streptomyces TaxID=2593676 RepID=UPI0039BF193B